MPSTRKDILLTEFVVEVYPKKVEWDGLERFILTLLKQRPEDGYDRAIKEARYRARRVRP